MVDSITALQDAPSWTFVCGGRWKMLRRLYPGISPKMPDLVFCHPDGTEFHVFGRFDEGRIWSVNFGSGPYKDVEIAVISKTSARITREQFLGDLALAYDADARARLDRLVYNATLYFVRQGIREEASLSRVPHLDDGYVAELWHSLDFLGMKSCDHHRLPDALQSEMMACKEVLSPSHSGWTLNRDERIPLNLPTTQHGVLEFLQKAQQDGLR